MFGCGMAGAAAVAGQRLCKPLYAAAASRAARSRRGASPAPDNEIGPEFMALLGINGREPSSFGRVVLTIGVVVQQLSS